MIRIQRYSPPPHYKQDVQQRGRKYLARNPTPSSRDFNGHAYWHSIHDNLYSGICVYCATWTPRSGGADQTSIDHFIPKSEEPSMAYDWDNFRLCRRRLNTRKGASLEVMDPFYIEDGWFTIDFTSFLIRPLNTAPVFGNRTVPRASC